jgi:predicted GNAT superfamily acetyltransferase
LIFIGAVAKDGFYLSHSFVNDRGNKVTQYNISGGGYARVEKYKDGFVVSNIIIEKENRGKGYAKKLYEDLNKESLKETGKTLQSIKRDSNNKIELSKEGKALWMSFVNKGKAKEISKNRFRFV